MRLLKHPGVLCFLAISEVLLMAALQLFYFCPLGGGPILDFRSSFNLQDVSDWLTRLGPQGAETVLVWHYLTLDLVLPALAGLAMASLIIHLGNRLPRFAAYSWSMRSIFALAVVAPYVVFDYAQNAYVVRLLRDTFNVDPAIVSLASSLNSAKFAFLAVPMVLIVALGLVGALRTAQSRRQAQ